MPALLHPLVLGALGVVTLSAASAAGCARAPQGAAAPARRADLITAEEIASRHFANAYDVVTTLRPNWLNRRGEQTMQGDPGEIQVHLNGIRAGGLNVLHETSLVNITAMEYVDPIAAAARWGLRYNRGAILISTERKP